MLSILYAYTKNMQSIVNNFKNSAYFKICQAQSYDLTLISYF